MKYKIDLTPTQLESEKKYLTAMVYKLLPYKQENYPELDNYFESVLQRLCGLNDFFDSTPYLISVISLVNYARNENDFKKFRKAILDSCGMIQAIALQSAKE